jgi:hypothetical protein
MSSRRRICPKVIRVGVGRRTLYLCSSPVSLTLYCTLRAISIELWCSCKRCKVRIDQLAHEELGSSRPGRSGLIPGHVPSDQAGPYAHGILK